MNNFKLNNSILEYIIEVVSNMHENLCIKCSLQHSLYEGKISQDIFPSERFKTQNIAIENINQII